MKKNMEEMNASELKQKIDSYRWYHEIKVSEGLVTPSYVPEFRGMWDFNLRCLEGVDFQDKRVLDIGCRDGLFSFYAEQNGAEEVLGIDNDLSTGAVEFLIPHFGSRVRMEERNLYYLPETFLARFDIVICFGVLYHLRYPFWALKRILECLPDGGQLLLETGLLAEPDLENRETLYCPVENSPYGEPTSCTFFNHLGLETTLRSLRCRIEKSDRYWPFGPPAVERQHGRKKDWLQIKSALKRLIRPTKNEVSTPLTVCRALFQCRKDEALGQGEIQVTPAGEFDREWRETYWENTHREHSRRTPSQ